LNASSELTISRRTVFLVLNHASARKGSVTSAVFIQCFYGREKRDALERWGKKLRQLVCMQKLA
jgi:hypothetical protein